MQFYASLIGPLNSIYYPLPADDEHTARLMISSSGLKELWCSIYTDEEASDGVEKFGGVKLPDRFASLLDYKHHEVVANGGKPLSSERVFALAFGD